MTLGAHLLMSWLSTVELVKHRRERTLIALSGVAPDLDGLGIIVDKLTGSTDYYLRFHHCIGHSLLSAFLIAGIATFFAKSQKKLVGMMSFIIVHLHILCDVLGSKGPDGFQWPVYYLYPIDLDFYLIWAYQWELSAWPNHLVMAVLFALSLYYAVKKKISFIEVISPYLDREGFAIFQKYVCKKGKRD
ncbi:MAG: metal-dependent hydrolase [Arenicella sp.]